MAKEMEEEKNITITYIKVFEGEYLNGEKNGEGKEYYSLDGNLKFEGEYFKGKRNGKGKEYKSIDGYIIFEGEFLNDKRNGKGKEYNYDEELIFEGDYLNGYKWNGRIIIMKIIVSLN